MKVNIDLPLYILLKEHSFVFNSRNLPATFPGRPTILMARRITFSMILVTIIMLLFLVPLFVIQTLGEAEIRREAQEVATTDLDWKQKICKIVRWEKETLRSVYQRPHSGSLYIMPNCPYIYWRVRKPAWIAFFKHGACEECALLFVEIARLAGMHTRLVRNPGEDHTWAEVLIDNSWIHVDPSCEYYNDPGVYERSENGWGKQLSYVCAMDENGEEYNVTSRYSGTGRLIVHVEKSGKPVKGARVDIKSRFLVDSGTKGYGSPLLATSSVTDENGNCIFELGGNNYQIIAELGDYRAENENILLVEGENVYLLLSLSAVATSKFGNMLLWATMMLGFSMAFIVFYKTFRRFIRNLPKSTPTASVILMVVVAGISAYASLRGAVACWELSSLELGIILLVVLGAMASICGLLAGRWISHRCHLQLVKALVIIATIIGTIFCVLFDGFGFVVGVPIVELSIISFLLLCYQNKRDVKS